MIKENALFGAEISGHYFYGQLGGADDGLFSACRMIMYLAECGKSPGQIRKSCPTIYMTPDLRLKVDSHQQPKIIEKIQNAFCDYRKTFVDGVRIEFANGWALVRSSVTETALTFRFEAESETELENLVKLFCSQTQNLSGRLYQEYLQSK